MIDVKVDARGGIPRFEVSGDQVVIAAEVGSIISQIFGQSKAINPEAAESFRACIWTMLLPDSPVWSLSPVTGDGVVSAVIPWGKRGEGPGR